MVRELHFITSIVLALLLGFFAVTGFMAQHREWFHPRVDREDWSDAAPLGSPCDVDGLARAAGADPREVEALGDLLFVDAAGGRRLACRRGEQRHFLGEVSPWPTGVATDPGALRDWLERRAARRLEPLDEGGRDATRLRGTTVWSETTFEVDAGRGRFVTWTRRLPLAYSLIELHRGRGSTDTVVDATAALAVVVAVTGVLHGLRYAGRKRRLLVGLLLGSTLLVAALLAG